MKKKRLLTFGLIISMCVTIGGCRKDDVDSQTKKETSTENVQATNINTENKEEVSSVILNASVVAFPKVSEQRIQVEKGAKNAIDLYLVARAYLDEFLMYDINSGTLDEYRELLDNTIKAFENVGVEATVLEQDAAKLEKTQASMDLNSTQLQLMAKALRNPFVVTVYAAEESEAMKWAKDITEQFDKAPSGKGIRILAEQMGTDAKHAYAQLKMAQDIIAGGAYEDFASTANTAYKTAMVLKTAGSAAQLTLSIVTANPTSAFEAVMASGGITFNGINTILEVGQTSSVLIVGNDNKLSNSIENVENALAPIGSAIGLYGFGSNLAKGKELLKDTPALADTLMYMGTSIYDYMSEGKILGGAFKQNADGTIECTLIDAMTVKKPLDESQKETKEVLETLGFTDEEISLIQESGHNYEKIESTTELLAEMIDDIKSENIELLPDNYVLTDKAEEIINEYDDELEKYADEENGDLKGEVNNGVPTIDEIVGMYPFYLYMTLGEQSAEGEIQNTITIIDGNRVAMTDEDGYTVTGNYDSKTGIAIFYDSDGSTIKVTFSYREGNVHANLSVNADGASMSGDANKR